MALIKAGVCLYLQTKGQAKHHLHVILSDPVGNPPAVVVVSFSTDIKTDRTVVLNPGPGMHPFITEETFVVYKWTRLMNADSLEGLVSKDMTKRHHRACSAELLKTLRDGVFASPFTTPSMQEYCKHVFPKPPVKAPVPPKHGL